MKQKLNGGWEWDWTSKRVRNFSKWGAGVGSYIKRKMNKRFRKEAFKEIVEDMPDNTDEQAQCLSCGEWADFSDKYLTLGKSQVVHCPLCSAELRASLEEDQRGFYIVLDYKEDH